MSHEGANFGVGGGGVGGAEGGGLGSVSSSLGEVGNCRVSSSQKLGPWGFHGLSTGLAGWLVRSRRRTWGCKEVVGFGVFESEGCEGYSFAYTYALIPCIPLPVAGPRKGPLSHVLRLVAYNNTATHLNPPLEYYELKDN
jgi:hypothetical protein